MPGTPAGKGSRACRPYGETHHPTGDGDQGNRTGVGRHARKRAAERLGAGVGTVRNRVRAYREGGMAALRPENRNVGQADKPAPRRDRDAGDADRRIEEPELGNAVMREVAEVAEKDPGADLRRLSNREKTLPVDRPRPEPDDMLARHRAGRPPTAATPGSGLTIRRAACPGGRGVLRFQGRVRVPQGQGRVPDPRLGEGAPRDHGRGWSDGAYSRTTRVRLIRGREHAGSRQPRRPRFHGRSAEREVARMAGAHGPLRPDTVDGRQRLFPGRCRRGGVLSDV